MRKPMQLEKTVNNVHLKFDTDLYMRLYKIRDRINSIIVDKRWNFINHEGNYPVKHPLLYKIVSEKKSGDLYIIAKTMKQFGAGYYIMAQLETVDNDGRMILIENISSMEFADDVLTLNEEFDVTDMSIEDFFKNNIADWFNYIKATNDYYIEHFETLHK